MELEIKNGDYVADGLGGLRRVQGREALLQRVMLRLSARRGAFPFWEELGSRLWQLGRLPVSQRKSAAAQYVTEALAEEAGLTVEDVEVTPGADGTALLKVLLSYGGEELAVTMEIHV